MNEQIKLLAEQAGIITNLESNFFDKDPNKWVDYFSEKFAQLIVAECIDAAVEAQADFYIVHNIKSRFGIEE